MFKGESREPVQSGSTETHIGPSVKLEGNFDSDGDIVVEGMLNGTLSTRGDVRVGAQSEIDAKISAKSAVIAGKVKGNITCSDALRLSSTASVTGDVKAAAISIEEGAVLNGKVTMGKDRSTKAQIADEPELPEEEA